MTQPRALLGVLALLALLSACQSAPTQPAASAAAPAAVSTAQPANGPATTYEAPVVEDKAAETPILGKRADSHGCKPSTGHAWCERTKSCERPWELALQRGFENTPAGWHAYCDGSTR